MKIEELALRWIAETERVVEMVTHDFMLLDEQQLNYRVHVSHCNIRQIMQQVVFTNSCLINRIGCAIPLAQWQGQQQEYHPGNIAKYMLHRVASARCYAEKRADLNADFGEQSAGMLFSTITVQQNRIKELVTLCKTVDMNKRVVPFGLFGLIKLSIADTFEYLILYQKNHFIMARRMLMLQ